jgi:hypothetical protein
MQSAATKEETFFTGKIRIQAFDPNTLPWARSSLTFLRKNDDWFANLCLWPRKILLGQGIFMRPTKSICLTSYI